MLRVSILAFLFFVTACQTVGNVVYVNAGDLKKSGNVREALKEYKNVADMEFYDGRSAAAFQVGEYYSEDKGVPINVSESERYYRIAAYNNDDKSWQELAFYRLGVNYENGHANYPVNKVKAYQYYSDCTKMTTYDYCADGEARTKREPDVIIARFPDEFNPKENNDMAPAGIEKAFDAYRETDFTMAANIFKWHAQKGNVRAQEAMSVLYKGSNLGEPNSEYYLGWLYLASKSGSPKSQFQLGAIYYNAAINNLVSLNDELAEFWFLKSAEQGYADAYNDLAILYSDPTSAQSLRKTDQEVFEIFNKSASLGSVVAMVNTADYYLEGRGVTRDAKKAEQLYLQAAAEGNIAARTKLFESFNIVFDQETSIATKKATPKKIENHQSEEIKVVKVEKTPQPTAVVEMSIVQLFQHVNPSVYSIGAFNDNEDQGSSQGSGVALTNNILITNCHVIEDFKYYGAMLPKDDVAILSVLMKNKDADICLMSSDKKLNPIEKTKAFAKLETGEKVYAIGSPKGLSNTLSDGIVSGLRTFDGVDHIQTTASISPGSSGGGLFDSEGALVGVTTFQLKESQNLNFAVSISVAYEMMNKLTTN